MKKILDITLGVIVVVFVLVGVVKFIFTPTTTVFAEWGGRDCIRAEMRGQNIPCKEALVGQYDIVWVAPSSMRKGNK